MMSVIRFFYHLIATLLSLTAAAALLICLSYPDSVIPPDPAKEYLTTFTWYRLRGYVWALPLAAGVIVSLGPCFWRVWFRGMLTAGIAAFLAYPVLLAEMPEWVHPTMSYQGGMLATGLLYFGIILLAAFLLFLLLRFLFPLPDEHEESGTQDAAVLDPEHALTVREIAAAPKPAAPKFRFGDADLSVVQRFRSIWRRFMIRHIGRQVALLLGILAAVGWFFLYPQPTEEEALQRDLQRMKEHYLWKTTPMATRAAVHAGFRVMVYISDHESFAGMTRKEAEAWLGLDDMKDADYRAALRDKSDVELPSVNSAFESRERFLTLRDRFGHWAVLYIRTDAGGEHINIAEVQDAGWDPIADSERRRMGNDWFRNVLR